MESIPRTTPRAVLATKGVRVSLIGYVCPPGDEQIIVNRDHEFTFALTGGCPTSSGRHELGRPGDVFGPIGGLVLTSAEIPFHTIGGAAHMKIARLEIEPGRMESLDWLTRERPSALLDRCKNIDSGSIEQSMRRLAREAISPGFAAEVLVERLVDVIGIDIERFLFSAKPAASEKRSRLSSAQLALLRDYVHAHPGRSTSNAELAALVQMSPRNFTRRFRESTGESVHQFVASIQLEHAQALLRDRRIPIKEIAFRLGFASHANFSDAFRRLSGQSPSAFRESVGYSSSRD